MSRGKSLNRLAAYLHQKGLGGTAGQFMRSEIDRLDSSLRRLRAWQSAGHEPVTLEDARSVALSTYQLIGELASRTDFRPVQEYGQPAEGMDEVRS